MSTPSPLQRYDIYRPRTRQLERRIVYGMLGFWDEWGTLPPKGEWSRAYRKADTVQASTPAQAALLGAVLLGDVIVPATGDALISTGNGDFSPMPRPTRSRPAP